MIARSYMDADNVPQIGGYVPLIVLTDSMYPGIASGDMVICHTADASEVAVGDVIAFYDPSGNGQTIVTHRVIEITSEDGETAFRTQGDANNAADANLVPATNLVGVYKIVIPHLGNIALFMQTSTGIIVCVVIPLFLIVSYDIVRNKKEEKKNAETTEALLAELDELRRTKENA
jgi:signal peptidase